MEKITLEELSKLKKTHWAEVKNMGLEDVRMNLKCNLNIMKNLMGYQKRGITRFDSKIRMLQVIVNNFRQRYAELSGGYSEVA